MSARARVQGGTAFERAVEHVLETMYERLARRISGVVVEELDAGGTLEWRQSSDLLPGGVMRLAFENPSSSGPAVIFVDIYATHEELRAADAERGEPR